MAIMKNLALFFKYSKEIGIKEGFRAVKEENKTGKHSGRKVTSLAVQRRMVPSGTTVNHRQTFHLRESTIRTISAQREHRISPATTARSERKPANNDGTMDTTPTQQSVSSASRKINTETFKATILNAKSLLALESIAKTVDQQQALNHLTADQAKELKSLIHLRKGDLELVAKYDSTKKMDGRASSINTLEEATSFRRSLMKEMASGKLTASDGRKLQSQLTGQLHLMAKDREQAKRMTIELLKGLTGDFTAAKQIQQTVIKTVGYAPHKDTLELQERLYHLKRK